MFDVGIIENERLATVANLVNRRLARVVNSRLASVVNPLFTTLANLRFSTNNNDDDNDFVSVFSSTLSFETLVCSKDTGESTGNSLFAVSESYKNYNE